MGGETEELFTELFDYRSDLASLFRHGALAERAAKGIREKTARGRFIGEAVKKIRDRIDERMSYRPELFRRKVRRSEPGIERIGGRHTNLDEGVVTKIPARAAVPILLRAAR